MTEAFATVAAAAIGAAIALLTTFIGVQNERRRSQHSENEERAQQRAKKKIHYLDPLWVAACDLLDKLLSLQSELPTKNEFWRSAFDQVKTRDRSNAQAFAHWCNGEGAGPVTTLYVTAAYFARSAKIRAELPLIGLGAKEDKLLLNELARVRTAFGGEYNLWVEIQDSIGTYVTNPSGEVMNYRDFCMQLVDGWGPIWFSRLIDFYRDLHMKKAELPAIVGALKDLTAFIQSADGADRMPPA